MGALSREFDDFEKRVGIRPQSDDLDARLSAATEEVDDWLRRASDDLAQGRKPRLFAEYLADRACETDLQAELGDSGMGAPERPGGGKPRRAWWMFWER